MSDSSSSGSPAHAIGIIAAIICFFFGFDQGAWIGGLVAAAMAYGGVLLAFAAIAIAIRLAAGAAVLLLILIALKNRWDWLAGLMN